MKGLSNQEFEALIARLQSMVGCRLQEVGESNGHYLLNFWTSSEGIQTWVLDLKASRPVLLPRPEMKRFKGQHKKSPLLLFLKAHFEGRILNDVNWNNQFGRVFELQFGETHRLEIRLFPSGSNLLCWAGDKSLSFKKPAPVKELEWHEGEGSGRPLEDLFEEWKGGTKSTKPKANESQSLEKKIAKIKKSMVKIEEDIAAKKKKDWQGLGEYLLTHKSLEVPEEWAKDIDPKLNPLENAQRAFTKGKETRAKIERAEQRLMELKQELENPKQPPVKPKPLKLKTEAKLRTKNLSSGHAFLVGKSAADNLKLLRGASSWDYWFHLKDYPGAHGILRRHRNEKISEDILQQAAQNLVLEHLKKKAVDLKGEVFDCLLAEVRFVRPIKGDKLGRVNYSNERVLSCRIES